VLKRTGVSSVSVIYKWLLINIIIGYVSFFFLHLQICFEEILKDGGFPIGEKLNFLVTKAC
jgi:hypothetical protein